MRRSQIRWVVGAGLALLATLGWAAGGHNEGHTKEDIQRHKAMAEAHAAAARCLESGRKYDACVKDLQAACKGLAIGKLCGMKHEH